MECQKLCMIDEEYVKRGGWLRCKPEASVAKYGVDWNEKIYSAEMMRKFCSACETRLPDELKIKACRATRDRDSRCKTLCMPRNENFCAYIDPDSLKFPIMNRYCVDNCSVLYSNNYKTEYCGEFCWPKYCPTD